MADDILGHEHQDHGKHLHKGKHAHGAHKHDEKHKEHDHHGEHTHTKVIDEKKPRHVGFLGKEKKLTKDYKRYIIIGIIIVPLGILFFNTFTAFALAIGIIALNALVELPKPMIGGAPVDFEVLSVGAAYLAAYHGFLPALLVALFGPLAAELSHGHISDFIFIKMGSVTVTALAALVLGTSLTGLLIAVLFGLVAQFFLMQFIGSSPLLANLLRRVTNGALAAYIIFFLVARLV